MSEGRILYAEKPQQCDLCGKIAELRPYGPNGETICFECMKSSPEMEAAAERRFGAILDNAPPPTIEAINEIIKRQRGSSDG